MVISKLRGYYIFVSNILILEREMGASHFSSKGNELLVECDEPTTKATLGSVPKANVAGRSPGGLGGEAEIVPEAVTSSGLCSKGPGLGRPATRWARRPLTMPGQAAQVSRGGR